LIAVIDYGAGNLFSIGNALQAIGLSFRVARTPQDLARASRIVLPGVGHFGPMMRELESSGLKNGLLSRVESGIPLLGICLGMQALYESSEEAPGISGLKLLNGDVKRFPNSIRVPQIGWNDVNGYAYYFANSYYAPISECTIGAATYGVTFSAIVQRKNITAVQFHPEKSGTAGLQFLTKWCAEC